MRPNRLLVTAALASLAALVGCDKARPLPAPADPSRGCTSCHGGQDNSTGAPPFSLPRNAAGDIVASGNRFDSTASTSHVEVGAHTRHISRGVSCGACHVVPATIQAPDHNTGKRATVTFKELAAAGNVVPSTWNLNPAATTHTCTNYCHGSSLNHGGTNHTPDWLGGTPAGACGTCHFAAGVAPPAAHPQGPGTSPVGAFADTTACARCHPDTVNTDGTINVTGGKHVNGQLDGGGGHSAGWYDPANPPGTHGAGANGGLQNCTSCHGTDFNGGSSGVSCNACHATKGHPYWQSECTFCHGARTGRTGDSSFPPVPGLLPTGATSALQVQANLAAPPVGSQGETNSTAYAVGAHEAHISAGPFARAAQCSECHGPTLPSDLTHVGGTVWIGWGATASNGITPVPAAGNLVRWSDATGVVPNCTNFCHGATLGGGSHTSPLMWNEGATGASCGSCHKLPIIYTAAGAFHVQRQDCATCHPGYAMPNATNPAGLVNLADHIYVGAGPQGLTCTSCHGSATNPAPGPATNGDTATSSPKVGAHQKHLTSSTFRASPLACTECHPTVTNTRHATGGVNLTWNLGATVWSGAIFPTVTPAAGGNVPAGWEATPTCTNYCHGGFTNGKAATVSWTSTTAMTCNSCHGAGTGATATLPIGPPTGTHPQSNPDCSACHGGYTTASVNQLAHINGSLDVVSMSCTTCHGDKTRVSVAGADLNQQVAPPVAVSNALAVGAHLAHVNQGATTPALSNPFLCVNCHTGLIYATAPHTVPANPVVFGNLATVGPVTPLAYTVATQTCSSTYCHGNFTGGKGANPITWNPTGKLTCFACHGTSAAVPEPAHPHPQNPTCGSCHAGATINTVAAATHVNGAVDRTTSGCTSCHGELNAAGVTLTANTVKAAPGGSGSGTNSFDTTGLASGNTVGAHKAHLVGATGAPRWRSAAIACTECHALPPSNTDTTHATNATGTGGARATLAFGNLANDAAFEVKVASYTQPTCSSVYCHDPKTTDTAASQNNAPAWNGATTTVVCGSCHGLPPVTAAHPTGVTECASCHGAGYATTMPTSASTIAQVNSLLHINGTLDGGGDCTGCHNVAQTMAAGGTRRAIVPEFALAWSHKRSATPTGTVTKWDCIVCHMEGDPVTGNTTSVHKDGVINLRDPDTGNNIQGVTFTAASGASPGSYATTATNMVFTRFSRNLAVTLEADANAATLQAIMINMCLKCHDSNGAMSASARVPVSVMPASSSAKPFGTTIAGATYTGAGVTANAILGGVVDVNEAFKTTNSSYHPVTGKQNNWYAKLTRMAAPWNTATRGTAVDTTSWGPLISCWDCHALPTDAGTIVQTVTAHGGTATLRGNFLASGGTSTATSNVAVTLCVKCHAQYDTLSSSNHGTGSAFSGGGNGGMANALKWQCNKCHGSFWSDTAGTVATRPVRSFDVHGVNALPTGGKVPPATSRWGGSTTVGTPTGTANLRPYAFIRNTTALGSHSPLSGNGFTYSPNCTSPTANVSGCGSMSTYSVGGTY